MADHTRALTDQQIQEALEKQIERTMLLHLDLLVLQRALTNKNLLTDDDIAEATQQVHLESKEMIAKIGDATRKGPAGGIQ